jgi:hypothetical protein
VTTIEDEQTPANRGYLVIACVRFHTELRPLLDLYLWIAGKTFQWLDGEASVAGDTPDMALTFGEDGALVVSSERAPARPNPNPKPDPYPGPRPHPNPNPDPDPDPDP